MTWEIVLGIITLAGFILTVCKVVQNNTQALTEMRCSIDELIKQQASQNEFNKAQDCRLNECEKDIALIRQTLTKKEVI